MQLQVTDITFDLDGDDSIPDYVQDQVQQELRDEYISTKWIVVDEDDLVNEISCQSGWCIESINYDHIVEWFPYLILKQWVNQTILKLLKTMPF